MNSAAAGGRQPIALLLTATIDPGNTLMVARRDPQVRLADYRRAYAFWLQSNAVQKILFCENTDYDLSSIRSIASQNPRCKTEFISFRGNEAGAVQGKGYAEMQIIQHALSASSLLDSSDVIVKCTGRLTVRNAAVLFEAMARAQFDVMCTLKNNLAYADSRFFAGSREFLTVDLFPTIHMIDDNRKIYFEHALACATAHAISRQRTWRPFPRFPLIDGISGSVGSVITNSAITGTAKSLYHQLRNKVYQY
jgi:hypothetical protein